MKKFTKIILSLAMAVALVLISTVTSLAADLDLGDAQAKVGDTVTYVLNLSDCSEPIIGLQMQLIYDDEYLEINDSSVQYPNVGAMVSNSSESGVLYFNFASVQNPVDFSDDPKELVVVDFTVLKEGNTEISYFVTELYGMSAIAPESDDEFNPYLSNFAFTYTMSVNSEIVVQNGTPTVNSDSELMDKYQGDFINYADGKGEEHSETNENHIAVTGVTSAVVNPLNSNEDSSNITTIIACVVGAVVVIGIILILVILKSKSEAKEVKESQPNSDNDDNEDDSQ